MDLEQLAKALSNKYPLLVERALVAAQRNPSIAGAIARQLEYRARREHIDTVQGDPFLPRPTPEDLAGDIPVGRLSATGESFAIDSASLHNLLICGEIRTGKTNLLYVILSHLCEHQ